MGAESSAPVPQQQAAALPGGSSSINSSVSAVQSTICSGEMTCQWNIRHTRNPAQPYAMDTLCRSHRYHLLATFVDMVTQGYLDGLQACSDAAACVVVRGQEPDVLHILVLRNLSETPHMKARFSWATRIFGPVSATTAARFLFNNHCLPSTRVFLASQTPRPLPIGQWLAPYAVHADSLPTQLDRQERVLYWTYDSPMRRDLLAKPLTVLFEQTTVPDPRLPDGGVKSLWEWLGGASSGALWVHEVAVFQPS